MSRDRALRGRDFRYQIDVRNPSARIPFSFTRERTATRLRAFSRSPHCFATFSTSEADTPLEHSDPRTDQLVGVGTTRDSTRMVEHRRDFKGVETVGARTQMQSLDEFSRTSCCRFTRPAPRRACIIATSHVVTFERGRTRTTSCAGSSRDAELFRQQARHERSSRRALSRGHSRRSSRYTRSRTRRPRDRYLVRHRNVARQPDVDERVRATQRYAPWFGTSMPHRRCQLRSPRGLPCRPTTASFALPPSRFIVMTPARRHARFVDAPIDVRVAPPRTCDAALRRVPELSPFPTWIPAYRSPSSGCAASSRDETTDLGEAR